MPKSSGVKHGKADVPGKKKKGRPKKKASKLNSPSRKIEKEERKGRGRPRKNPPKPCVEPLGIEGMRRGPQQLFGRGLVNDDNDEFVPRPTFQEPGLGKLLDEEALEQREALEDVRANKLESHVMTRRSLRSMTIKEERARVPGIEERISRLEEMLQCLGMMVLAQHKKTVNKDKKQMIDEHIRRGYNVETARVIRENMLRDPNYFDKTRRNSVHYANESQLSLVGSMKQ